MRTIQLGLAPRDGPPRATRLARMGGALAAVAALVAIGGCTTATPEAAPSNQATSYQAPSNQATTDAPRSSGSSSAGTAAPSPAPSTPATSSPATPAGSVSPTPSRSPSGQPTPEPSPYAPPPKTRAPSPVEDPQAVPLVITIGDGQVSPNGEKLEVAQGARIAVSVTSDIDDEIHAHLGGDGVEIPVRAGTTVRDSFMVLDTGSFEVESHELGKIIVILNVR